MIALVVLVVSLAPLIYAWLIFPVVVQFASRRHHRLEAPRLPESMKLPRLDIVIAAHNEAAHIAERVRNLLAIDYPRDRVRILIGDDGSEDGTAALAREAASGHEHIIVQEFLLRRGKVAVLKDLVAQCKAPLMVFSDANTMFRPDALQRLVRPLSESGVGGACGKLVLGHDPSVDTDSDCEEGFYWDWETRLKISESHLDSCLGANGAIFVIRRELFWTDMPDNTLVDDFVIGMKVREQGFRFVYEPSAVAFEELPELDDEWVRRVRIGAGDFQALGFCKACLHPRFGWFALFFISHKALRWFTPHLGLVATLCGFVLMFSSFEAFRITGLVVVLSALSAVVVALFGRALYANDTRLARIPRLGWHFVSMQLALLVGFVRYCRGNMGGHWIRTPRK
jgi:cellulose synthase/poly-beta-1,6-N-acetylglucosamine synthase-like glycosyltransferase